MTASLMPPPVLQFTDSNGVPLAGGLVYTYAAGTSTPQASYTDSTQNTANTNPVVLDSNGEASIWISGNYKINLTDVNGVQQPNYPVDNVQDLHTADNVTGTSTTSLSIAAVSKTFTTQTNKYWPVGTFLLVTHAADITKWMHGQVTAYSGTQLTVNVTTIASSGTFADWTITLSGPVGPQGIQGASGAGSGDMVGANNLAVGAGGVANATTARTNLGLGSVATHDVGTAATQIPVLDGNAFMPAVDIRNCLNATTPVVAWVNFTGATGAIQASKNVTSITRVSAGVYTINLTAALADTKYAVIPNGAASAPFFISEISTFTRTTSTLQIGAWGSGGVNHFDPSSVSVVITR